MSDESFTYHDEMIKRHSAGVTDTRMDLSKLVEDVKRREAEKAAKAPEIFVDDRSMIQIILPKFALRLLGMEERR